MEVLAADERVGLISNIGRRIYDTFPKSGPSRLLCLFSSSNLIFIQYLDKIKQHAVDFEKFEGVLEDKTLLKTYDIAFMVHGTTRRQAGSAVPFSSLFVYNLIFKFIIGRFLSH